MNRPRVGTIAIDAFYDNFSCASLFRKLRIPGSPEEIVDPRSARTFWVDESQQILAGAMVKVRAILAILSALRKGDRKEPAAKREDIESFLADWSSYIKP
jgi:hypothetical protein